MLKRVIEEPESEELRNVLRASTIYKPTVYGALTQPGLNAGGSRKHRCSRSNCWRDSRRLNWFAGAASRLVRKGPHERLTSIFFYMTLYFNGGSGDSASWHSGASIMLVFLAELAPDSNIRSGQNGPDITATAGSGVTTGAICLLARAAGPRRLQVFL